MGEYFASQNNEPVNGSEGDDTIHSSYSTLVNFDNLTLHGLGGSDLLYGGGTSSSTLYGDEGSDALFAVTSQNTVFYGGDSADELYAQNAVNVTFYGDGGDDLLAAGNASGTVTFYGGDGNDFLTGDNASGDVTLYGGAGFDNFQAGATTDTNVTLFAYGGAEDDSFSGNDYQGNLTFSGGGGDDRFYTDSAINVTVDGGDGEDIVYFQSPLSAYEISFDTSTHTMSFTIYGQQNVVTVDAEYFAFSNGGGAYTQYTYDQLACFLAGTRIRTPDGEVAIETLKAGDLVLTTTGEAKPVLWLGRRAVATAFAHPLTALPIHIRPDALGRGLPERDLFVSPDHAFFIGGMLVQAGALVNGVNITRHRDLPETFTYYHVELEDHDLIFAEGLPAETFIDNQERETFDNAAEFPGRSRPAVELDLPRVKSRRQLPKVLLRALEERVERFGIRARAA